MLCFFRKILLRSKLNAGILYEFVIGVPYRTHVRPKSPLCGWSFILYTCKILLIVKAGFKEKNSEKKKKMMGESKTCAFYSHKSCFFINLWIWFLLLQRNCRLLYMSSHLWFLSLLSRAGFQKESSNWCHSFHKPNTYLLSPIHYRGNREEYSHSLRSKSLPYDPHNLWRFLHKIPDIPDSLIKIVYINQASLLLNVE